jgi:hypothetical protein
MMAMFVQKMVVIVKLDVGINGLLVNGFLAGFLLAAILNLDVDILILSAMTLMIALMTSVTLKQDFVTLLQ